MSYGFDLRFDETAMPLAKLLAALAAIFRARQIIPQSVTPLVASKGRPTVKIGDTGGFFTDDILTVSSQVERWWGLNVYCVSMPLMERFGRSDNAEVDFSVFRTKSGKRTVRYKEGSSVFRGRTNDDAAAHELYELQLSMTTSLGFRISVFDEELAPFSHGNLATLHEVEKMFDATRAGRLETSIVVASTLLPLSHAKTLAGARARDVSLTEDGYIQARFLKSIA